MASSPVCWAPALACLPMVIVSVELWRKVVLAEGSVWLFSLTSLHGHPWELLLAGSAGILAGSSRCRLEGGAPVCNAPRAAHGSCCRIFKNAHLGNVPATESVSCAEFFAWIVLKNRARPSCATASMRRPWPLRPRASAAPPSPRHGCRLQRRATTVAMCQPMGDHHQGAVVATTLAPPPRPCSLGRDATATVPLWPVT